jgi:hypothetical protein
MEPAGPRLGPHATARVTRRSHEGGFSVPYNTISRHATAYTTNTRFVAFLGTFDHPAQEVWLPGNDIQDPTTWIVPSLRTLKHLHETLLQDERYEMMPFITTARTTEQPVANPPAQPSAAGGSASANSGATPPLQSAHNQDDSSGTLVLLQLNRLYEAYKRRQDALPVSSTSQDLQPPVSGPIPSQQRLTQQLITHWPQFKALCGPGTLARSSRSSACCTCLRSTKPLSRILLFVWK